MPLFFSIQLNRRGRREEPVCHSSKPGETGWATGYRIKSQSNRRGSGRETTST